LTAAPALSRAIPNQIPDGEQQPCDGEKNRLNTLSVWNNFHVHIGFVPGGTFRMTVL
jgi:hypothetical protein